MERHSMLTPRRMRGVTGILCSLVAGSVVVYGVTALPRANETPARRQVMFQRGVPLAPAPDVLLEMPEGSGGREMVLCITVPEGTVRESHEGGRLFHAIDLPGYGHTSRAGEPRLPVKGYYLAVPAGAAARVVVLESEYVTRSGVRVQPASRPVVRRESGYIGQEFCLDESLYSLNRLYPEKPVEIGSTGYIRDIRVVQLRIFPVQFNPRRGEIRIHRKIWVKVELLGGAFPSLHGVDGRGVPARGPFETLFQNVILNYRPGITGTGRAGVRPSIEEGDREYLENDPWKVSIAEDGVYGITCQDLIDAGADPGNADPATIRLFNVGVEEAIYVSGEGDGQFDPGDAVYFFGRENKSEFSRINVYWLSWGSIPGLRMEDVDCCPGDSFSVPVSFAETLHVERDLQYEPVVYNGEGKDHWFWEKLIAPCTSEYPLVIPNVYAGSSEAEFTVALRGYTDVTHRTEISFNRYLVVDCTWDGMDEHMAWFTVPRRYIGHINNKLIVNCPSSDSMDQTFFNWVQMRYQRSYASLDGELRFVDSRSGPNQFEIAGFSDSEIEIFRITDPHRAARMVNFDVRDGGGVYTAVFEDTLDGEEYVAFESSAIKKPVQIARDEPSNLRSPANSADYIVITHSLFEDAVEDLAQYRRSEGLAVDVVTIDDVYDEFNYGNLDPGAIRDFLSYAFYYWREPAPFYVLLVGDASHDYRGNLPSGNVNYVPTHVFYVAIDDMETAGDDWFACVAGNDVFPDLLIGRITAQNAADVTGYVDKVVAYETDMEPGAWREKVLLIADNPDDAGNFPEIIDGLAENYIEPAGYDPIKIYRDICYPACKQEIIDAIDEGCVICNYVGHGSVCRWMRELAFTCRDVASLNNADRYPLVVTNTCLNGCFNHAVVDYSYSLAEEFARADARGAIACWSYSGLSYAPYAAVLAECLYEALLHQGNYILGSAACQAKVQYLTIPFIHEEEAMMLILFGDPALEMGFPVRPDLLIGNIAFRPMYPGEGEPDTLVAYVFNAGRAGASGVTVSFTHGHPDSSGSTPIGEATVPSLEAGNYTIATAVWDSVPEIGSYPVHVRVDPADVITESCEWNNNFFDTLTVSPPCAAEDTVPPVVTLFVDEKLVGGEFEDSDYTSNSPEITALLEDTGSGVDVGEVRVTLNGAAVEDFELEHGGHGSNSVTMRYHPASLTDGVYTLRVRAADCGCGPNAATATVTFVVESTLTLLGVTNFPNPCRDGTCFTFSLSQPADEVTIRIYSVTGALIRTVRCSPGARNCNEYEWDGTDRYGNPLASGVYFYRLTARGVNGHDAADGKFVIVR
jgi:hypothetical protein